MVRTAIVAAGFGCKESTAFGEVGSICRSVQPDILVFGCDERDSDAALRIAASARGFEHILPVVLIVERGSEALAVAALRAGVHDYLRFPFDPAELIACLTRFAGGEMARPRSTWPAPSPDRYASSRRDSGLMPETHDRAARATDTGRASRGGAPSLIGSSAAMRRVQQRLDQVAQSDANVLITGETGTGKELAAAYLHEHSPRGPRRMVTVNCAAIPETLLESELFGHEKGAFTGAWAARPGLLESADGGTVFLDEVGEMGLQGQAKILRAIESREVYRVGGRGRIPLDIRVVAATNQDLEQAVEAGRFRKDLYFRLQVASIQMPPLRDRQGDIAELLDHYLREFNARATRQVGLAEETRCALNAYEWPGNVRELKNLVESLCVCPPGAPVGLDDLPETFRARLERFCAAGDRERRALLEALFVARWNKSRAAEILSCSRMTLYRRMAKYSVVRSEPRRKA